MAVGHREFFTEDEITADKLLGILDLTEPRQRRILDWVFTDDDNDEEIEMDVVVQDAQDAAPLAGFGDRTPFMKGRTIETIKIEPYHIKMGYPFNLESKHLQVGDNRVIAISDEGLNIAVASLEERRIKRHVAAIMAMLSNKVFSYTGNNLVISVPYDSWIPDISAPGTPWTTTTVEAASDVEDARGEFEGNTGQAPVTAWVSSKTASTIKKIEDVKKALDKQAPRDPDLRGQSYDQWSYGGLEWHVLRDSYRDAGVLQEPLPEGLVVLTVDSVDDTGGGSPIVMNKARNKLNRQDASSPFYEAFQTSKNPPIGGVGGYDNGIPSPAREGIIAHWQVYPTP